MTRREWIYREVRISYKKSRSNRPHVMYEGSLIWEPVPMMSFKQYKKSWVFAPKAKKKKGKDILSTYQILVPSETTRAFINNILIETHSPG